MQKPSSKHKLSLGFLITPYIKMKMSFQALGFLLILSFIHAQAATLRYTFVVIFLIQVLKTCKFYCNMAIYNIKL